MDELTPKTSPKPDAFNVALLNGDAVRIGQKANQIAHELDYWYIATHHLLCSLLEHDLSIRGRMFSGLDLTVSKVKTAMVAIDPPGESAINFKLPTSVSLWDCYMHAIMIAESESRLATPYDILNGLFNFREPVVDAVLAKFDVEIFDNRQFRTPKLKP